MRFLSVFLLATAVASAETLVLVDPDGNEYLLQTTDAVSMTYGPDQELLIETTVDRHLGTMTFSTTGIPSPFQVGNPILVIDGLDYLAVVDNFFQGTLSVGPAGQPLDCHSQSGIPVFPSTGAVASINGVSIDLQQAWPDAIARIQPAQRGGVQVVTFSVFDDLSCGATFQDFVFFDGLEDAP